jgi:D-arabinose 1-dehydrogenase-like Zn-dependent alcohol dehydrogenase
MKAAVVPAKSSSWQIKDVPQPQPGPGQVLVKMRASGICYTDVHQNLGHLPGQFPRILGYEPVGEIVAVAPDVTTRKVSDRVGSAWIQATCGRCEWCQRGRRMFCPYLKGTGGEAQGGHAEYMLMNADATYLIPDKVSYEQAAPIFCAGYTVYSGLRWADPQPHERVAVLGIGGLGHLAVQYAKAAGFETIAISHSPEGLQGRNVTGDFTANSAARTFETAAGMSSNTSRYASPSSISCSQIPAFPTLKLNRTSLVFSAGN